MEIRVENTLRIGELDKLRMILNTYFDTDFVVDLDGTYAYMRDNV